MKIALVLRAFGFRGGIERYAFDLAGALRARGHELELLHDGEEGRDPEDFAKAFSRVTPLADNDAARGLDVAYVQNAWDPSELGMLEGVPLVFAAHDHDHTCVRRHRYVPLGRTPCHAAPGAVCVAQGCVVVRQREPGRLPIALRSPFALRDRLLETAQRGPLVACSHYVAERLREAGAPQERVFAIHPVPPPDTAPTTPAPAEPRLLVAAQLIRGKGVDIAIEALAALPDAVSLDVVGDGPSRQELAELAARRAPGRVRFLGYVRPDAMTAAYDAARVVVVPSRWPEPFGLIGVEAMRRARPVVGADHGGIPEWAVPANEGGRTFRPGDPLDLAVAVAAVLRDPEAGARAKAHVERQMVHGAAIDQLCAVLSSAAAARAAPSAARLHKSA